MERRYQRSAGRPIRLKRNEGEEKPILAGYASVFYNGTDETEYELWKDAAGRCVERVLPGAFARAIKEEDDCRALFNHDSNLVLGRTAANTLRLTEDEAGLAYEIDLPDTQLSRDLAVSVGRGDVSGSSFAFNVRKQSVTREVLSDGTDLIVREIKDVDLYDVGPVTFPAYASSTTGLRSAGEVADIQRLVAEARAAANPGLPRGAVLARARAVEVEEEQ